MSVDFGFNIGRALRNLKDSRIERLRNNIQNARVSLEFQERNVCFYEHQIAKWTNPEAFHIAPEVLKDSGKAIQTKDFRDEFVIKRHAAELRDLEEAKNALENAKAFFEKCEREFTEELRFENETFEEFKARTKENPNG